MAKNEIAALRNSFAGLLVAQGVLTVLFGIAALFWPGLTTVIFISLFGVFVLVWGIIALVSSFLGIGRRNLWWLELIFSLLLVSLGVYLLQHPAITAEVLVLLVGFTFVVRGLVDVVSAFFSKDREVVDNKWLFVFGGVLGVVLGVVVLAYPVVSGLAFVWAVGLYAVLYGALTIALAFKVRA